jgi:hypothetical protein
MTSGRMLHEIMRSTITMKQDVALLFERRKRVRDINNVAHAPVRYKRDLEDVLTMICFGEEI